MRRIVIAIVLFIIIVVTIFIGNFFVKQQCNEFKTQMTDIATKITDNKSNEAYDKIKKAKGEWHSRKAIISIFSNHEPLDEITVSIDELVASIKNKDDEKSIIISARIIANIDRITEEQRIHVESFF